MKNLISLNEQTLIFQYSKLRDYVKFENRNQVKTKLDKPKISQQKENESLN